MAQADEKILVEIEVNNDEALKALEKQNAEIQELEQSQKFLAKQGLKNTKDYQQQAQQLTALRQQRKQNLKAIEAESGSLNELRVKLAQLTAERNNLSDVNGKNAEDFKRLNSEILELNDSIKAAEQSGGDFRRNVGNYSSALDEAVNASGGFGQSLQAVGGIIKASPIGILVSALAGLVAAWGQTERGARFFAVAGAALNSILDTFIGYIGTAVNNLVEFEYSWENIGNAIQNFFISRVERVIQSLGVLGDAIGLLFEGEFTAAAKTAAEGLTGLALATNPVLDAVVDLTKETIENTSATIENAGARYDLERAMLAQQKTINELIKEEERLNQIADDSTLSLNEQKKANEEYEEAVNNRLNAERKLINDQLTVIQNDLAVRRKQGLDTFALQQELSAKQVELAQKDTEIQQKNYEQQQRDRQINQDQWEQDLDFIIDIGTRRADVLLKQSQDETLSLQEREQALRDYRDALTGVQEGIINSFEESGLSEEEFNRLLGIRDPEELAEAIRQLEELSEVENNRLKEGLQEYIIAEQEKTAATQTFEEERDKIRQDAADKEKKRQKAVASASVSLASDVFKSVSDFLEKGSAEQKAFAIADATVNTYKGITNALANVPAPLNIPAAALVGAKGFAAVSSIASTGSSNVSTGGSFSGGGVQTTQPQVNTNAIDQQVQQQEALIAATESIGLSISVTEINDVQRQVSTSEQTATI